MAANRFSRNTAVNCAEYRAVVDWMLALKALINSSSMEVK